MTCYSTVMIFSNRDEMDRFMDWVVENQASFPIIRAKAWRRYRQNCEENQPGLWVARVVFRTADDVRRFHMRWAPEIPDDIEIEPWGR